MSVCTGRFAACRTTLQTEDCQLLHKIIFSIGITTIPCAPACLSWLILSQKSRSGITVCTATQPSSAKGTTDVLLTPGNNAVIAAKLSFLTFSTTYLVSFALNTD